MTKAKYRTRLFFRVIQSSYNSVIFLFAASEKKRSVSVLLSVGNDKCDFLVSKFGVKWSFEFSVGKVAIKTASWGPRSHPRKAQREIEPPLLSERIPYRQNPKLGHSISYYKIPFRGNPTMKFSYQEIPIRKFLDRWIFYEIFYESNFSKNISQVKFKYWGKKL